MRGTATPEGITTVADYMAQVAADWNCAERARLAIYDFAAARLARQFEVTFGYARWLPDGRHVISFNDGALQTLDTVTGQVRSIDVLLTLPGSTRWDPTFAIARDGRTIYYGARRQEADIWLAERLNRN